MKTADFEKELKIFHNSIMDIIKKYQFRNRNEITCCGISVSQCYVLETLYSHGSMPMKQLAKRMHLAISTITRLVEQLEKKNYVVKSKDSTDLRKRQLSLTQEGKDMFLKSWSNVLESEREIFGKIKSEHRKVLNELLTELNNSVDYWQSSCKLK